MRKTQRARIFPSTFRPLENKTEFHQGHKVRARQSRLQKSKCIDGRRRRTSSPLKPLNDNFSEASIAHYPLIFIVFLHLVSAATQPISDSSSSPARTCLSLTLYPRPHSPALLSIRVPSNALYQNLGGLMARESVSRVIRIYSNLTALTFFGAKKIIV